MGNSPMFKCARCIYRLNDVVPARLPARHVQSCTAVPVREQYCRHIWCTLQAGKRGAAFQAMKQTAASVKGGKARGEVMKALRVAMLVRRHGAPCDIYKG